MKTERLWDLVRYARQFLYDADLIDETEYAELLQHEGAVDRLENYDSMRARVLKAEQDAMNRLADGNDVRRTLALVIEARDLLMVEVARLKEQLAEARRDGARLDWVIRNFEEVNFDGWHDYADMDAMDLDMENEVLGAWRKYIDAAMGGE